MARRPTAAKIADPAPSAPWTLFIDGKERRLLPTTKALQAIERNVGWPLYGIMTAGKEAGISIERLAVIVPSLIGAAENAELDEPDGHFNHDLPHWRFEYQALVTGLYGAIARDSATPAMIVEAGVLTVTAVVAKVFAAALAGRLDAGGNLKPLAQAA